jgi:hypothetical protein
MITKEQKYRYFLRLNTMGHAPDPEHLEKMREKLKEVEGEGHGEGDGIDRGRKRE